MKILWLASWYPSHLRPYDGDFIQRHAKALASYTPVTVFYVTQLEEDHEKLNIEQIDEGVKEKIIFFDFKKTGFKIFDKLSYNWKYYKTYKKTINEYFKKEGLPDIVHVHVPIKAGMIARWIKKKWSIPFIVSEHSAHYKMDTEDDFSNKSIFYRLNVAKVFKDATAITNVSLAISQKIKEIFSLQDIRVIHNTVDTSLFNYKPRDISIFRFIHVSILAKHQKNIAGVLNAVEKLLQIRQDFELIIVGPADDEVKQTVQSMSLDKYVTFTGEITYAEVAKQMQQASALLLFSRYENFPCVIIEGLCCGLPVISSDVGGVGEVVNESNGILIKSENEKELLSAMNRMIEGYQVFNREKIAESAKEQFGYPEIGKQFYELYKEILHQK